MKRYTVVWHQLATDDLAEIWLAATDQRAVTAAANRIDALLADNPAEQGSQVSPRTRELTVAPLQVLYHILEDDRIVRVFSASQL